MDATHSSTQHFAGSANDPIVVDGEHDLAHDLARHDDDGWGGKGPPPAPADDDYFAADTGEHMIRGTARPAPHSPDAHGRPSPAPAQGSPGAGPTTRAVAAPLASLPPSDADDDVGNGADADPFAGLLALTDAKSWTQSRTIQAIAGMAITATANKLGAHLDNATIRELVGYASEIAFALLSVYAVISRVRATRRIAVPLGASQALLLTLLTFGALFATVGCATATPAFVRSERATQRIVSPTLAGVIDGTLPPDEIDADERASIHNTLDLWDANLRHAEAATTRPTSP